MNDNLESFDVLIVGGGAVGLTLALALVQSARGIRVGLVDRRPLSAPRDARASAIAAGVRRVFDALGVWPGMLSASQPISAMRITDSGEGDISRPLFLAFDGDVVPGEPFAHMVPNSISGQALLEAIAGKIEVIAPATITGFVTEGNAGRLTLADGRVLAAPLVVAADGGQSVLRGMAGIGVTGHDYRQTGLVTTIAHELPHDGIAYEHFRPAGPFASLPLPGNRSSLVWTERTDDARRFLAMDDNTLAAEIEAVMGSTLGAVTLEEKLQGFPLRLQIARDFVAPRLALVGDAAHVVHPIAGQGLNLGLKDVAALAEVVVDAIRLGLDHGSDDVLGRYQAWRRLDTAGMAAMTDTLNRLFSNDVAPVRAIRDFGLGLVDRAGPVKAALIRTASGISGKGPKLLSGLPI
ncbi:FAD-dependent monooxygenase [Devosia psychrophila]|uniref:2-octaprenyl-6-methoxyphenol hydroxylase n=1 Tax=Devosia psychrophila TaxID=728005 RepID=A0A0F5PYW2_9HYPH|nr:FAD-dependent monooxygenase [Devosia psychrophila]KKC33019.1 2-octaprenyl-6-methoxyphenyl hydroxylase [Devosia psychrophila]SFC01756.1 2-octaprenyl-6-methoxyphenol hydroxylase [Devosia psychrophila]